MLRAKLTFDLVEPDAVVEEFFTVRPIERDRDGDVLVLEIGEENVYLDEREQALLADFLHALVYGGADGE